MRMILASVCALFLSACVTGEKMENIHRGMSRLDVVNTLGQPDTTMREGEYEALIYSDRLMSGWSSSRTDYHVILRNREVVEYGHGQVRRQKSPVGVVFVLSY